MQICFLTSDYPTTSSRSGSGIGTFTLQTARALTERGIDVSVVSWPDGEQCHDYADKQIRVYYTRRPGNIHYYVSRIPWIGRLRSLILLIKQQEMNIVANRKLSELSENWNCPTVVETPNVGNVLWKWNRALKSKPYVVMIHGSYLLFKKETREALNPFDYIREHFETRFMVEARAVIAPSEFVASYYREKLGTKIHCIPSPVVLPEASSNHERNFRNREELVVLSVSALTRSKGLDTLIQAIPYVLNQSRHVRFVIVGHEADYTVQTLRSQFERDGVADAVDVIGYVPWEQIASYFSSCDVFVSASRCETFGQTIAEAMLAGKPVVATKAGAIPEVVDDGITGLLVNPGDPESLANQILRLCNDADLRKRMGTRGAEKVKRQYGIDACIEKRIELYRWVLASG
jgi:glycosyltransferase involved in cell wall biosynthesis